MDNSNRKPEQTGLSGMDIAALRRDIDDIDDRILALVNSRLSAARKIGRIKDQSAITVVDSKRESEIYERLSSLNDGTLNGAALFRIFRSIIAAGRGVQRISMQADPPPLYAVFGDPIGHSLSPVMHNSALAQAGLDGFYLAFRVKDIAAAVSGIRGLGIRGASITIPHKVSVMDHLDRVDSLAAEIGAVNTVVNQAGKLHGFNSDCTGAIKAIHEKTTISGMNVAVIGAGGGARAVGFGIQQEGGRLTIMNRSRDKGKKLASDLDSAFIPLQDVKQLPYDIIINATSVGMAPLNDRVPLPVELLNGNMVVMDMVYNPLKTRLLTAAEEKGCTIIDGLAMFVHQGAAQFELWTGEKAPVDIMREVVLDELMSR